MVDGAVDAALDECALAPVHDLASRRGRRVRAREVPAAVDEGVEQAQVGAGEVLARFRDRRAVGLAVLDQVVVEHRAAHEQAEILAAIEREFRDHLVRARDAALAVVEVAVVDVRRAAAAAVRQCRSSADLAPRRARSGRRKPSCRSSRSSRRRRNRSPARLPGRKYRGDERGQRSNQRLGHVVPQCQDQAEFRARI